MPETTKAALLKTLGTLIAQRAQIDGEIKVIRGALSAIGVKSPALAGRRPRKPMTDAERRTVSRRMKVYWAKQRSKNR